MILRLGWVGYRSGLLRFGSFSVLGVEASLFKFQVGCRSGGSGLVSFNMILYLYRRLFLNARTIFGDKRRRKAKTEPKNNLMMYLNGS